MRYLIVYRDQHGHGCSFVTDDYCHAMAILRAYRPAVCFDRRNNMRRIRVS